MFVVCGRCVLLSLLLYYKILSLIRPIPSPIRHARFSVCLSVPSEVEQISGQKS